MHNEFDFMIPKKESIRFSGTRSFFLRRGLEVLLSYILVTVILVSTIALAGANKIIFASNRSGNAMFGNPMSGNPMSGNPISENPMSGNPMSGNPTSNYCGNNAQWTFVGDTLTITGTGKMYNYSSENLPPWYQYRDRICSVIIQSGITSIGAYAFYECNKFTYLDIPDSVISIGTAAFCRCYKLIGLKIPNSVTSIGDRAFEWCIKLKSIRIPDGVTSISDYLFSKCYSLTDVIIPEGVTVFNCGVFASCDDLKNVNIPNSVTRIGEKTFWGCLNLTSITIPENVTEIGSEAFYACEQLGDIIIPKSVKQIGCDAFLICDAVTNVYFSGTEYSEYKFDDIVDDFGATDSTILHIPSSVDPASLTADTGGAIYYWYQLKHSSVVNDLPTEGVTPLAITNQPVSCKQLDGKKVNFSVGAEGDNLTYQWQFRKPGASTWANAGYYNAKTDKLTFVQTEARSKNMYRCVVTDAYGRVAESDEVEAILVTGPSIVKQPVSVKARLGTAVSFAVEAEGEGLSYQWQFQKPGKTTWANSGLASAKKTTLKFKMAEKDIDKKFRCIVTDVDGFSVISEVVSASLLIGPVILTQPTDVDAAAGAAVRISTAAEGDELKYRWQYQKEGQTTWINSGLASATLPTLTFKMSASYDGRKFRCKVTDADGNVEYTDIVAATLVDGPAITKQPEDVEATLGDVVYFNITATGDGLTYQWQYQASGKTNWINSSLAGNKTAKLRVKATDSRNGGKYRCVVTDEEEIVAVSYSAVLIVN